MRSTLVRSDRLARHESGRTVRRRRPTGALRRYGCCLSKEWFTGRNFLCASLLLLFLAVGCGQKKLGSGKNYAEATTVGVTLGKRNLELGLRLVEWVDSHPQPASVGGRNCRTTKRTPQTKETFFYFIIDPTFKTNTTMNVSVEVEYFDATQGRFALDYHGAGGPYTATSSKIQTRTLGWETAIFLLRDARLDNTQNANADFRLRISTPEFFLHKVTVCRDLPSESAENAGDGATISISLGTTNTERGLRQVIHADGRTMPTEVEGRPCRQLDDQQWSHIYFAIDPAFKTSPHMNVKAVVEYFDEAHGNFDLQYDGWETRAPAQGAYTSTPTRIPLNGSLEWKTAEFLLNDARFENRQNGQADFRLRLSNPTLYVSRVTLLRQ